MQANIGRLLTALAPSFSTLAPSSSPAMEDGSSQVSGGSTSSDGFSAEVKGVRATRRAIFPTTCSNIFTVLEQDEPQTKALLKPSRWEQNDSPTGGRILRCPLVRASTTAKMVRGLLASIQCLTRYQLRPLTTLYCTQVRITDA